MYCSWGTTITYRGRLQQSPASSTRFLRWMLFAHWFYPLHCTLTAGLGPTPWCWTAFESWSLSCRQHICRQMPKLIPFLLLNLPGRNSHYILIQLQKYFLFPIQLVQKPLKLILKPSRCLLWLERQGTTHNPTQLNYFKFTRITIFMICKSTGID